VSCGFHDQPSGLVSRTRTEEVPMPTERSLKTLAIRLDDRVHAQLAVLAQLSNTSITDLIRKAIEAYIDQQRTQGDLADKAAGVLEEIEREADARRSAIQALFEDKPDDDTTSSRPGVVAGEERPSRARKGGKASLPALVVGPGRTTSRCAAQEPHTASRAAFARSSRERPGRLECCKSETRAR
jgi:predicted transcriptional regulator